MDMDIDTDTKGDLQKLQFSNYTPRSEELKKKYKKPELAENVLSDIKDEQDKLAEETRRQFLDPELDVKNAIPKRGNLDMKLALAPKFEKLDALTRQAIKDLARKNQKN